jgi:hypothetical protein
MAKNSSASNSDPEKKIRELEKRLDEAKKSKKVDELEAEIAFLKSQSENKSQVVVNKGKSMPKALKIVISIAFVVAGISLVVAFIEESGSSDSSAAKTVSVPAEEASQCIAVSPVLLEGLTEGESFSVGRSAALRGEKGFFVALEIEPEGEESQTGVWLVYDPLFRGDMETGLVLAANGVAKKYTVYPDAAMSQAAVPASDSTVKLAESCLDG